MHNLPVYPEGYRNSMNSFKVQTSYHSTKEFSLAIPCFSFDTIAK